ncbi:LOW QUALITY PROTEIN: olfactory receptor 52Z1P-like [Rhynchonycteris naso]
MELRQHLVESHKWLPLDSPPDSVFSKDWISVPICSMYIVATISNIFLIFLILTECSLHQPMYFFLSKRFSRVLLSTATAPTMLAIFWFHSMDISFGSCVSQMFFIHFIFVAESAILLVMAFDHYVAICYPFKYATILTSSVTGKIGIAAVAKSFIVCFPFIFLVYRLTYYRRSTILHSYCEHMGIARLARDNINVNIIYGLAVTLFSTGLDAVFIIMSYTVILLTVFQIPSWTARCKAISTCGSHICIILLFYAPAENEVFLIRYNEMCQHW